MKLLDMRLPTSCDTNDGRVPDVPDPCYKSGLFRTHLACRESNASDIFQDVTDSADQGELNEYSSASEDGDIPEESSTPFDCLCCAFPDLKSLQGCLAVFYGVDEPVRSQTNLLKASKIPEKTFDLVGGKGILEP